MSDTIVYPWWRIIYLFFAGVIIGGVFVFLNYMTYGMVGQAWPTA